MILYLVPAQKGVEYITSHAVEAAWSKGLMFKTRKGEEFSIQHFGLLIDKYDEINLTYGKGNHKSVKIWEQ